jgi:hypothetical protein
MQHQWRRSGKRKEGVKTGWNSVYHQKNDAFLSFIPLKANVLFCRLKKISPGFEPNWGFGCYVFLSLWKTLLQVVKQGPDWDTQKSWCVFPKFQWLPMALPSIAFTCCPHEIWIGVNFLHAQLWLSRTVAVCLSLQIDETSFVEPLQRQLVFFCSTCLICCGCWVSYASRNRRAGSVNLGLKKVFYSGTHKARCQLLTSSFIVLCEGSRSTHIGLNSLGIISSKISQFSHWVDIKWHKQLLRI